MRLLFILCSFLFIAAPLDAALAAPAVPTAGATALTADLSREAVEAQLGRKLKFSERIALSIVRKKAKKQARKLAKNDPATVLDVPSLLSMIFGIFAFILTPFTAFAIFPAIAALVLGIIGLGRVKREEGYRTGKGFAIAGIALGGVWLLLALILLGLLLTVFR